MYSYIVPKGLLVKYFKISSIQLCVKNEYIIISKKNNYTYKYNSLFLTFINKSLYDFSQ